MDDPIAEKIASAREAKQREHLHKDQALIEGPRFAHGRAGELEQTLTNQLSDILATKLPLTHAKGDASARAFQLKNERSGFFIQVLIEVRFAAPGRPRVDITAHLNKQKEKIAVPTDQSGAIDFSLGGIPALARIVATAAVPQFKDAYGTMRA